MFQFAGLARAHLCIQCAVIGRQTYRVSPFRNLRINACVQLPVAYRSLSRLSSPAHAKASTIRPYHTYVCIWRVASPVHRK